jgi:hypothetical protein
LRWNTRFEPSTIEIGGLVRAVGEPEIVKEKRKQERQCYSSRVRGGGTPVSGMTKLGTFVDSLDAINYGNFHLHIMNILRASVGQKRGAHVSPSNYCSLLAQFFVPLFNACFELHLSLAVCEKEERLSAGSATFQPHKNTAVVIDYHKMNLIYSTSYVMAAARKLKNANTCSICNGEQRSGMHYTLDWGVIAADRRDKTHYCRC